MPAHKRTLTIASASSSNSSFNCNHNQNHNRIHRRRRSQRLPTAWKTTPWHCFRSCAQWEGLSSQELFGQRVQGCVKVGTPQGGQYRHINRSAAPAEFILNWAKLESQHMKQNITFRAGSVWTRHNNTIARVACVCWLLAVGVARLRCRVPPVHHRSACLWDSVRFTDFPNRLCLEYRVLELEWAEVSSDKWTHLKECQLDPTPDDVPAPHRRASVGFPVDTTATTQEPAAVQHFCLIQSRMKQAQPLHNTDTRKHI